jgi:phosphatidylinositol alpha-1,6-mannosyltransferase
MKQVFGVESTVCRYGVRIPTSCPTGAGSGHVLSVGTLEEHKGHDLVIEALSLLPPSTRPRLLLIANDGNPGVRARLVAQAAQAEVDLEISILPRQEELDQAYADASLLAFAGIDEPLGLVVLEAMAHSIPVVAVAEGGVLETVAPGRSGYLVPRQPQAMADRIAELVADPDRAREMGREGRRIVETDWNWPDRAAFLESILESVAVPRPRLVPTGVGG